MFKNHKNPVELFLGQSIPKVFKKVSKISKLFINLRLQIMEMLKIQVNNLIV